MPLALLTSFRLAQTQDMLLPNVVLYLCLYMMYVFMSLTDLLFILFNGSMAFMVTEHFLKLVALKDFLQLVIKFFTNQKNIIFHSHFIKFWKIIFMKKELKWVSRLEWYNPDGIFLKYNNCLNHVRILVPCKTGLVKIGIKNCRANGS